MPLSTSTAHIIVSFDMASMVINRYVPILIYVFGLVGNMLNILVLGQRTLRTNPSAACFLLSSIANIFVLLSGLTSRMMSGYAKDLTLTISWICKTRNLVLYTSRTVALWSIALAAIDRWLSSSLNDQIRRRSSLRNIESGMVFILIFSCLINAPILYCYEANLSGVLRKCYGSTPVCRIMTDMIYAFITTMLPLCLMVIFGLLTIKHVRQIRRRIESKAASQAHGEQKSEVSVTHQQSKRKDRQLSKMLLVQILLLCLFTCPHAIQKLCESSIVLPPEESVEHAVNTFIFDFVTLLTYAASGMSFYIYTLSGGSVFRNASVNLFKKLLPRFLCCAFSLQLCVRMSSR